MTVQEYLSLINEKFSYLFREHGFRVVFTKEFRSDHNIIGLESDTLRILFEQERGGFGVFIGGTEVSFNDKKKGWVNVYSLMAYLLKREIDWSALKKYPYSEQVDVMFSITSREFALLYMQISEMFYSTDAIAQWKPMYDQYVKEKIQLYLDKSK